MDKQDTPEIAMHGGSDQCSFVSCKILPEFLVIHSETESIEFFCPVCIDKPEVQVDIDEYSNVYAIHEVKAYHKRRV